jgi:hypothetical protein
MAVQMNKCASNLVHSLAPAYRQFFQRLQTIEGHTGRDQPLRLQVYAAGFFAHVFEKNEVVTCALDVPTWPHVSVLVVPTACLADPTNIEPLMVDEDVAAVMLDSWDVRFDNTGNTTPLKSHNGKLVDGLPENPGVRASWEIIELVPDFSEFCVGAQLSSTWRSSAGIVGTFTMHNGDVRAFPTKNTFARTWSWTGRDGKPHRQPIADIVGNVVGPVDKAFLSFTSRQNRAETHRVQLRAPGFDPAYVVLFGIPCDWFSDQDATRDKELEIAHMHATLRLCDVPGGEIRCVINALPQSIPEALKPKPTPDGDLLGALFEIDRPGKINCTARRLIAG